MVDAFCACRRCVMSCLMCVMRMGKGHDEGDRDLERLRDGDLRRMLGIDPLVLIVH